MNRKKLVCITMFLWMVSGIVLSIFAQNEVPTPEQQINAAVSPVPEDLREGAAVLGYNEYGELLTLREGTNEIICLADDPFEDRFHVACYHKDLETFMKRGRELRKEGKSRGEVLEMRRREIESGDIPMPKKPMALYSLTGKSDGYDYSAKKLREASPLYVIYVPFATEESTGISPKPFGKGAPWLMDAGKPWAHIMISTGQTLGEAAQE